MGETTLLYKTRCATDDSSIQYSRWPVSNVISDLVNQGGLERECLTLKNAGFDSYLAVHQGSYNGTNFEMRWEHERFLLVRLERESPELVEAFSRVLERKPLASYHMNGSGPTFEWDQVNPNKRYEQLALDEERLDLKRLN